MVKRKKLGGIIALSKKEKKINNMGEELQNFGVAVQLRIATTSPGRGDVRGLSKHVSGEGRGGEGVKISCLGRNWETEWRFGNSSGAKGKVIHVSRQREEGLGHN